LGHTVGGSCSVLQREAPPLSLGQSLAYAAGHGEAVPDASSSYFSAGMLDQDCNKRGETPMPVRAKFKSSSTVIE